MTDNWTISLSNDVNVIFISDQTLGNFKSHVFSNQYGLSRCQTTMLKLPFSIYLHRKKSKPFYSISRFSLKKNLYSKARGNTAKEIMSSYHIIDKKPHNENITSWNVILWKKAQPVKKIRGHSSEIRGLCLMKWPSKMLQNLPYFYHKKPM